MRTLNLESNKIPLSDLIAYLRLGGHSELPEPGIPEWERIKNRTENNQNEPTTPSPANHQ